MSTPWVGDTGIVKASGLPVVWPGGADAVTTGPATAVRADGVGAGVGDEDGVGCGVGTGPGLTRNCTTATFVVAPLTWIVYQNESIPANP